MWVNFWIISSLEKKVQDEKLSPAENRSKICYSPQFKVIQSNEN